MCSALSAISKYCRTWWTQAPVKEQESLASNISTLPQSTKGWDSHANHCVNDMSADLVGLVSRVLIEDVFFQNNHIPQELLLELACSLIHDLQKPQQQKFSLSVEMSILWKELCNTPLSPEEKEYDQTPKQLDGWGEILNGIKYSSLTLLGRRLHTSITSAVTQGLAQHVPVMVGLSSIALFGSRGIAAIVDELLENRGLSVEQKQLLRPWLNMIGRLALGFLPKVHATKRGVHSITRIGTRIYKL